MIKPSSTYPSEPISSISQYLKLTALTQFVYKSTDLYILQDIGQIDRAIRIFLF